MYVYILTSYIHIQPCLHIWYYIDYYTITNTITYYYLLQSGDDFSRQSTQAIDNYDNFYQTIMDLEASQVEDPVYQAPQPANHYTYFISY